MSSNFQQQDLKPIRPAGTVYTVLNSSLLLHLLRFTQLLTLDTSNLIVLVQNNENPVWSQISYLRSKHTNFPSPRSFPSHSILTSNTSSKATMPHPIQTLPISAIENLHQFKPQLLCNNTPYLQSPPSVPASILNFLSNGHWKSKIK